MKRLASMPPLLAGCGSAEAPTDATSGPGAGGSSQVATSTEVSSTPGTTGGSEVGSGAADGGGGGGGVAHCNFDDGSPERIVQIASNYQTSLAVSSRGRVACWGMSNYGECLGAAALTPRVIEPAWIPELRCIKQADIDFVAFSVDQDGGVQAWGTEYGWEFGDGPGNPGGAPATVLLPAPAAVVWSGGYGGQALLADGTYVWGELSETERWDTPQRWPMDPQSQLFRRAATLCRLDGDGRATCRGKNTLGNVGDGTFEPRDDFVEVATEERFSALALAGGFTCGTTLGGALYCWGSNSQAQLGVGIFPPSPTPDNEQERSIPTPTRVALDDVMMVDLDVEGGCALDGGGVVSCWGANRYQRYDSGADSAIYATPVEVPDLSPAQQISVGTDVVCALKTDGSVWCRGNPECRGFHFGDEPPDGAAAPMHFDFEAPL